MKALSKEPLLQFGSVRKVQLYWVRHRWTDFVTALILSGIWLFAGRREWVPIALEDVAAPQRQVVYQIAATIGGTLAGFTLTSVSVLVNLLRTPMSVLDRLLPDGDKARVGGTVMSVLPNLLLLFSVAFIGVVGDSATPRGHWWIQVGLVVALLMSTLALARVVWVLRRLLSTSAVS